MCCACVLTGVSYLCLCVCACPRVLCVVSSVQSCAAPLTFYTSLALTLIIFKGIAFVVVVVMAWRLTRRRRLSMTASDAPQESRRRSRRSSVAEAVVHATQSVGEVTHTLRAHVDWFEVLRVLSMYLLLCCEWSRRRNRTRARSPHSHARACALATSTRPRCER